MKKKLLLLLTIALISINGFSQKKNSDNSQAKLIERVEIEVGEDGYDYTTPCGENGVLMHGLVKGKKTDSWVFHKYDKDLKSVGEFSFEIKNRIDFKEYYLSEDKNMLALLFTTKPNSSKESMIVIYDAEKDKMKSVTFKMPKKILNITDFIVLGDNAFLKVQYKLKHKLLKIKLTGKTALPEFVMLQEEKDLLVDLYIVPGEKEILLSYFNGKGKKRVFFVQFFGNDGKKTGKPIKIELGDGKSALSASATKLDKNDLIICGSYSISNNRRMGQYASGFYFMKIDGTKTKFRKFHKFADFENFFEYYSPKKKEKVEKKIQKQKDKGKEVNLRVLVASHPMKNINGEYVYLGEIYFPTYRTEYRTTTVNGQTTTTTVQVFDGYQYTHSVILGMDEDGNKQWDFCFPMWMYYKPRQVKKFVRFSHTEDQITMVFANGNEVKTNIISNGVFSENTQEMITSKNEAERVKRTDSYTEFWYEDYYVIYGKQVVKGDKKRRVIFANKVQVSNYI
jgi:hypothetical protein